MKRSCLAWRKIAGTRLRLACSKGTTSSMSKSARALTRIRITAKAAVTSQEGTGNAIRSLCASSSASWRRLANGESRQTAPSEGSLSTWRRAVTAPMERPQRPIGPQQPVLRRCSRTAARSSRSCQPSETYSPSDSPQPAASKQNKEIPCKMSVLTRLPASRRLDELPWR